MRWAFVEVIALPMRTATAFVIAMNLRAARTALLATTTLMRRKTTVHVTSAHALGACNYGYTLAVEEHAVDVVPGQTTYRLYVDLVNADDFLSSVYGNDADPLSIATDSGFYNDTFGSTVASGINPHSSHWFLPLRLTVGLPLVSTARTRAMRWRLAQSDRLFRHSRLALRLMVKILN